MEAARIARPTRHLLTRVAWRDLTAMRPADGVVECLHPLPWIAVAWIAAAHGWWLVAFPCAFMIFLTALRLNHEAIHRNLGFGERGHRAVLHVLSALMLGSNSAVAWNHLHHHTHVGKPDDLEGKAGAMPGWRVLLYGPKFPVEMHLAAWRAGGPALRRRMRIDFALNAAVLAATLATGWRVLAFHILAMLIAQCLTAFFAVWITHHDCADDGPVARTQRSRLVNMVSYNMFFHLEHHLFPAVPVKRLAVLAERLDAVAPEFTASARRVVPEGFD
ncbi:fatty acid desaturase [Sphingomonas donggukensis]|uniref:Fatty acid desaturase n=1 Tax=Sphingomonas donggukensis TaxID=2949093 RepID=A0ABY4TXU2_9SPHN|nr:fatty acid desaturase [Sphingomonas donggukensis]URW76809.1 fatty acid desaturase [Sphingomonas donggukensis]